MAVEGRCPLSVNMGSCRPLVPKDIWDWPDEFDYSDLPEVGFMGFIAGLVDAIELADRRGDFRSPTGLGRHFRTDRSTGTLWWRWLALCYGGDSSSVLEECAGVVEGTGF